MLPLILLITACAGCIGQSSPARDEENAESFVSQSGGCDVRIGFRRSGASACFAMLIGRWTQSLKTRSFTYRRDDPTIANVAVYCTFTEHDRKARRLFFLMFENAKSPEYARNKDDLTCLLINADGKVIHRDDDYWNGLPQKCNSNRGRLTVMGRHSLRKRCLNSRKSDGRIPGVRTVVFGFPLGSDSGTEGGRQSEPLRSRVEPRGLTEGTAALYRSTHGSQLPRRQRLVHLLHPMRQPGNRPR